MRFKNLTWVGTDKGLYNDGNSILSDHVQFGLETELQDTEAKSAAVQINDISNGENFLYCCDAEANIYRLNDEEWKKYKVPGVNTIHKILIHEASNHYAVIVSHNKITTVNITPSSGVFS